MEVVLVLLFVLGGDLAQAVDVVIAVEQSEVDLTHILLIDFEVLHLLVHAILADQGVCHFDSQGFDRVTVADLKHREILVVVV